MNRETLDYASPPMPKAHARCAVLVLAFVAASFASGLACNYACGSFDPQVDVGRGDTMFIYGRWVPTVVVLRIILLAYTALIMGKKAFDLASERRYVTPNAWMAAIGRGMAFGVFTEAFRLFRSNPAALTLLIATLMLPAAFPFAFLRRRSP
jgi:hypothetical protein